MNPLPIIRDTEGDFDAGCSRPAQKVLHRVCRTLDAPEIENLQDTRELETGGGSPIDSEGVAIVDTCIRAEQRAPERRSRLVNPELPPPIPPCTEPPTGTFTVSPNPVCSVDTTATLSWTSVLATSVSLDGEVVELSGSREVSPSETTTYRLVLSNSCGVARLEVTLTLEDCAPIVDPPEVTYDGCQSVVTTTWGPVEDAAGFRVEISDSESGPWSTYIDIPNDGTVEEIAVQNYFQGVKWLRFSVGWDHEGTRYYTAFHTFQPLPSVVPPCTVAAVNYAPAGTPVPTSPASMNNLAPSGVDGSIVQVVSSRENPLIGLSPVYCEVRERREYPLASGQGVVFTLANPDGAATIRLGIAGVPLTSVIQGASNGSDIFNNNGLQQHIIRGRAFKAGCTGPECLVLIDIRRALGVTNSHGWDVKGRESSPFFAVQRACGQTTVSEAPIEEALLAGCANFPTDAFGPSFNQQYFYSHLYSVLWFSLTPLVGTDCGEGAVPRFPGIDNFLGSYYMFTAFGFTISSNPWTIYPAGLWATVYMRLYANPTYNTSPSPMSGGPVFVNGAMLSRRAGNTLTGALGTTAELKTKTFGMIEGFLPDTTQECLDSRQSFQLGYDLLDVVTTRELDPE